MTTVSSDAGGVSLGMTTLFRGARAGRDRPETRCQIFFNNLFKPR
jgi:hypothetical protein